MIDLELYSSMYVGSNRGWMRTAVTVVLWCGSVVMVAAAEEGEGVEADVVACGGGG